MKRSSLFRLFKRVLKQALVDGEIRKDNLWTHEVDLIDKWVEEGLIARGADGRFILTESGLALLEEAA